MDGNLKQDTELLIIAVQEQDIRMNLIKKTIDKTKSKNKYRISRKRNSCKLAQKKKHKNKIENHRRNKGFTVYLLVTIMLLIVFSTH